MIDSIFSVTVLMIIGSLLQSAELISDGLDGLFYLRDTGIGFVNPRK